MKGLYTIVLLLFSNIFMTFAWYGHLKFQHLKFFQKTGLLGLILASWLIAFMEYCLMVPANRIGKVDGFNLFQLKMIQEAITLIVFCAFAVWIMKEPFQWRYIVSFALLMGAVYFMFSKQPV